MLKYSKIHRWCQTLHWLLVVLTLTAFLSHLDCCSAGFGSHRDPHNWRPMYNWHQGKPQFSIYPVFPWWLGDKCLYHLISPIFTISLVQKISFGGEWKRLQSWQCWQPQIYLGILNMWLSTLKIVHCVICELYHNKTITKKIKDNLSLYKMHRHHMLLV